jgi:peptide/nickel transport system substrate-binding protein
MPASVIEAAGDANLEVDQIIGTGPYKFSEWSVDNYVKLELFDGYQSATTEKSGAWGDRTSTIPTIKIYFVVDTNTRLNGLETGEYDIATSLAYTDINRIEAMESVSMAKEDWNSITITMNKSADSVLSDPRWRQIISYAMNAGEILEGSFATSAKVAPYYADACYFSKESQWYTDVSSVQHQDLDKAKALLKEIGYDGKPLVMMTTEAYPELYNATLILQQELEAIGVKVTLNVYDWGTMLTKISDTTAFDLYPMNYPASSNPASVNYITKTNASGFTNDPQLNEYIKQFQACKDTEAAIKFWNDTVMPYCAEQVFILHLGTYDLITGVSNKVEGFEPYYGLKLWGLKVAE